MLVQDLKKQGHYLKRIVFPLKDKCNKWNTSIKHLKHNFFLLVHNLYDSSNIQKIVHFLKKKAAIFKTLDCYLNLIAVVETVLQSLVHQCKIQKNCANWETSGVIEYFEH